MYYFAHISVAEWLFMLYIENKTIKYHLLRYILWRKKVICKMESLIWLSISIAQMSPTQNQKNSWIPVNIVKKYS